MRSLEQIPSLFVLMLEGHLEANTYVNIDIRHYTNCFFYFFYFWKVRRQEVCKSFAVFPEFNSGRFPLCGPFSRKYQFQQ